MLAPTFTNWSGLHQQCQPTLGDVSKMFHQRCHPLGLGVFLPIRRCLCRRSRTIFDLDGELSGLIKGCQRLCRVYPQKCRPKMAHHFKKVPPFPRAHHFRYPAVSFQEVCRESTTTPVVFRDYFTSHAISGSENLNQSGIHASCQAKGFEMVKWNDQKPWRESTRMQQLLFEKSPTKDLASYCWWKKSV